MGTRNSALSWIGALAILATLAVGCSGCGSDGEDSDVIRIGVAGPFSGESAAFGVEIKQGATLMVEEINAKGGIGGKKIEIQWEDDKGNAIEATSVARKLAGDESILVVIGHFNSNCSLAGKEEYNRKGVVEFSPGSTNVKVCQGGDWTFRNLDRDDYQGEFLAKYAKLILNRTKVAVFFDNDAYGAGLKDSFVAEAKELGLEHLAPIAYERGKTPDYKSLVDQIRGQGADLVLISGLYGEAALIAKAVRDDLQMDIPILGGDGLLQPAYIENAGSAAENSYVATPFIFEGNDSELATKFFDAYKKRWNVDPSTWSALTYDAVGMALVGIEKAGTDRTKIRDWFATRTTVQTGYVGVTGNTYFDSEGDCPGKGAYIATVKNGKFTLAPQQLKIGQ